MAAEQIIKARVRGYMPLIEKAGNLHGIQPHILAGLVAHESHGDPWAERLEENYKWLWGDQPHERPFQKPRLMDVTHWLEAQKWSRGLCQVMVATACEHGFGGWPSQLHDPWTGLAWGAFYLAKCIKKERGNVERGLKRYNGSPSYPPLVMWWAKEMKK